MPCGHCDRNRGAEAATVNWTGENNWWCPPVTLIPRVIGYAKVCKPVGTVVVLGLPLASFGPILHPSALVKACCVCV